LSGDDQVGEEYNILTLLPVLQRLANSFSVRGLEVFINLMGSIVDAIETNNINLSIEQERVIPSTAHVNSRLSMIVITL